MKNIFLVVIIVLVVAAVLAGGYYVYVNYFTKNQPVVNLNLNSANGPKSVYTELIDKIQRAKTVEGVMNITMDYTYFLTPADRNRAISDAAAQIQKMTAAQRASQLALIKSIMVLPAQAKVTETINGNNAVVQVTAPGGYRTSVNMIKNGAVWELARQ